MELSLLSVIDMCYWILSIKNFIKGKGLVLLGIISLLIVGIIVFIEIDKMMSNVEYDTIEGVKEVNQRGIGNNMPRNTTDLYNLVASSSSMPDGLLVSNKSGYMIIMNKDMSSSLYVEYDKTYDCTVVRSTLEDGIDPIKIFHHMEYNDSEHLALDIISYSYNYVYDVNSVDVNLKKDNTGNIEIEIK